MIKTLDHIGIAVYDLEGSVRRWQESFNLISEGEEEIPQRGVKVHMLRTPEGIQIELITPLGNDSPVAKSLEKRGEGIHHFCFEVEDIHAAMEGMKKNGIEFVSSSPAKGAEGSLVAFINPKSLNGVLVELKERKKG